MKNSFLLGLMEILRNSGRIGLHLSRKLIFVIRHLTWPQLLFASVGVIALVAILHLALFLFILFMIFKFAIGFSFFKGHQQKNNRYSEKQRKHSEPYTIDM